MAMSELTHRKSAVSVGRGRARRASVVLLGVGLVASACQKSTPAQGGRVSATASTLVAAPADPLADGVAAATIQVVAVDASGAPVADAAVAFLVSGTGNVLTPAATTTAADGLATATLASTRAEPKQVSATVAGVRLGARATITFRAGPASVGTSTLEAPASVLADGVAQAELRVTVRDAFGNPVQGEAVTLEVEGSDQVLTPPGLTDASGVATGVLTSTRAEAKRVTAWIGTVPLPESATIVFEPGPPSAERCALVASPAEVFADGSSQAALEATILDVHGNPIPGAAVALAADSASLVQPAPTGADGVARGAIAASTPGARTVTANLGGVPVASADVRFDPVPDPSRTVVTLDPPVVPADGVTAAVLTVTLRDAASAAIAGELVSIAVTGAGGAAQPAAVTTDASGSAVFRITATQVGTATAAIVATVGGREIAVDTRAVQVVADGGPGPFVLRIGRTGGGRIDGSFGSRSFGCGTECDVTVPRGAVVTLVPSTETRSVFSGWSGACSGTGQCTVYVYGDRAVGAAFSACPGAAAWATQLGGGADDRAEAIATAPDGAAIVAGQFRDTIALGASTLASAGGDDAFVAKLSASGAPLWATRLGGTWQDGARAVAVDAAGDVYVAGSFVGTAAFGAFTRKASWQRDAFVAKLSGTDGAVAWVTAFGGIGHDEVRGIAVRGGEVAITGGFQDAVTLGAKTLTSSRFTDVFAARLAAADGSVTWATSGGGSGYDEGRRVAFDPASGDVLVAGVFEEAATLGGAALTGHRRQSFDGFLARWPAAGGDAAAWVRTFGADCPTDVSGLAVGEAGEAYVGATSCFIENLGGEVQGGWSQPFVSRWGADGAPLWTKPLGDWGNDALHGLSRAPDGTLVAVGSFGGDTHLGADLVRAADVAQGVTATDAWLARLSPAGDVLFAQHLGGVGRDDGLAVAASAERAFLAGAFRDDVAACTGTLHAHGGADALVAAFESAAAAAVAGATWPPPSLAPPPPGPASRCVAPGAPVARGPVAGAPAYTEAPIAGFVLTRGIAGTVADFDGDGAEDGLVIDYVANEPGIVNVYALRPDGTGSLAPVKLPSELATQSENSLDLLPLDADVGGRSDVFVIQSGWDEFPWPAAFSPLWMQQDDGTLRDETLARLPFPPRATFSGVVGDADCDGSPDVYLPNLLAMNDGTGHFREESAERLPTGLSATAEAFCDLDRDGAPELVLGATGGVDGTRVLHNDGFGRFAVASAPLPPQAYAPGQVQAIACVDADGDGWNDLALLEASLGTTPGTTVSLWRNRGDGTFEDRTVSDLPQTDQGAHLLFVTDLNADGWPDLVTSRCNLPTRTSDHQLFLNQGGAFEERLDLLPKGPDWSTLIPIRAGATHGTDLLRLQSWRESTLVRLAP